MREKKLFFTNLAKDYFSWQEYVDWSVEQRTISFWKYFLLKLFSFVAFIVLAYPLMLLIIIETLMVNRR